MEIRKDDYLRPPRLRRSSAVRRASSSGEHSLTGVDFAGAVCLPTSAPLIGADGFLRLEVSRWRKTAKKIITSDHRGFAGVRPYPHAASSGEHSLTGVEIAGTVCLPMSAWLIGAGSFLRLGGSLPEMEIRKDDYLRPPRLRRSSAVRRASSSGEHSLTGVDFAGTVCLPMSTPLIGADGFLRLEVSRWRKTAKKIITSDHRGFAEVQPSATHPAPANILSPELVSPALSILR